MGLFKKSAKIKKCYKFIATYGYKIDPNNKTGARSLGQKDLAQKA